MGEKKGAGEGRQKAEEDIQAMEDRCNHLSKVKGKLEQSLDETEDALEREKKSKGDVEKLKRKIEVEKQVNDTNKRVKGEEELIHGIEQSGVKVTADANRLRDTIKTLEANCEKCEEDKSTKDNQIHTLREEIAHQEELISKLQKEKKGAGEGRQKAEEDIQAMEDRCNHLSKVK